MTAEIKKEFYKNFSKITEEKLKSVLDNLYRLQDFRDKLEDVEEIFHIKDIHKSIDIIAILLKSEFFDEISNDYSYLKDVKYNENDK